MIKKTIITIPYGCKYLNQYILEDGTKFELPDGILNKGLTGCGGTTLALENKEKTVICSPRRKLIENKHQQYPNTLAVISGVFSKDINKYLASTDIPKILVTYDSFYKLIDCIEDIDNWRIVIDEFQCLLTDSTFKSDTELRLLKNLQKFKHITYLSATPILDRYLQELHYFDNIPYYELKWTDVDYISIYREKTANPLGAAIDIVRHYQTGNFPFIKTEEGIIYSKEAVIYLNSVTNIVNIIKKTGLKPEEVNIIVANTEDNDTLIKKLGEDYSNGTIPLKGEKHKMITFCTSTAYFGVDFYSTNASTFVISDCKRANTSIDIATELTQISGRQRLDSNPFKNHIQFIYNTSVLDISEEDFLKSIEEKQQYTEEEIKALNSYSDISKQKEINKYKKTKNIFKYEYSYTIFDEDTNNFEFNKLAQTSEIYQYEVQKYIYQNGLAVRKAVQNTNKFIVDKQEYMVYEEKLKNIIAKQSFEEKMKRYIEHRSKGGAFLILADQETDSNIKTYYDLLGAKRIIALGCKEARLKEELRILNNNSSIRSEIYKEFQAGDKITKKDIKVRLQNIYDKLGLKKKATATQIKDYFEVREVKILVNNKRENGFEILI